jgi:hypothetical protein
MQAETPKITSKALRMVAEIRKVNQKSKKSETVTLLR